ncbi:MAG: DEAD/DEAH box helicase family protein [Clostridia bacterium]|nr:DEAD/DEAH box helicase family protein [Clostridia bacterium]
MKVLKTYQSEVVDKLISRVGNFLKERGNETLVFQAPTGSGKTFIMTKFIEELTKEYDEDLCFVWVSIGKGELHKQSLKAVKRECGVSIECSLLEDEFFGSRECINRNEIVFVNWEKIRTKNKATGDWKNVAMQDKETINFIEVLENTRNLQRKIILIIDESHSGAKTDRALEIRDEIVKPEITIEMSATPVLIGNSDSKIVVSPTDVINEEMIKKQVLINPNIDAIADSELDSQQLIMECAIERRESLAKKYRSQGSRVNPLVLIQLPNADAGEDKKNAIISLLREKGITEESGRVAIWLSDEKINNETERLLGIDGKVEYLIFKQAIDTGWDCPRAQILVKFRETNSIVFEIQTVGRILRMPEAKHYPDEDLNSAYVYTNIQSINVKKEIYNPNIIKTMVAKRREDYTPTKLKSYYKSRVDFGDVTSSFYSVFENEFCNQFKIEKDILPDYYENMEKLKQHNVKIDFEKMDTIIKDGRLSSKMIDELKEEITGDSLAVNYSKNDLFAQFNTIIKNNLNGFAPRRSISTVREAIYFTFKKQLNLNTARNGSIYIQNLIVKNESIFSIILDKATKIYKNVHEAEVRERTPEKLNEEWEIPVTKNYNPEVYQEKNIPLSLYQPLYVRITENGKVNELEMNFLEYINNMPDKYEWIWQNGQEHMETNFGIKKEDGSTFQPDFIIKFKDRRIGIFDTKGVGQREDDNLIKATALQKYILEERFKGKDIIGGLIIKDGVHFKVNMREKYKSYNEAPEEWTYFENL